MEDCKMIEDKKLGLKIAENPEEEVWETLRKNVEMHIKNMEKELIIQREILKLAESKLKK
jgi:hypothetical protein